MSQTSQSNQRQLIRRLLQADAEPGELHALVIGVLTDAALRTEGGLQLSFAEMTQRRVEALAQAQRILNGGFERRSTLSLQAAVLLRHGQSPDEVMAWLEYQAKGRRSNGG